MAFGGGSIRHRRTACTAELEGVGRYGILAVLVALPIIVREKK